MFCCPSCLPTRRALLAAGAGLAATRPRLVASAAGPSVRRVWIDAHCHVFNAIDLPMAEFIARTRDSLLVRVLGLTGVIALLIAGLRGEALTATAEARALGTGAGTSALSRGQVLSTLDALKRLRGGPEAEALNLPSHSDLKRAAPPVEGGQLVLEEVQRLFPGRTPYSRPVSDNELNSLAREYDKQLHSLGAGGLFHLLRWADGFAEPRNEIVRRLVARHPVGDPLMLTPAFVDYSRWLGIGPNDRHEPTSLADQILVAGALTRAWAKGQYDERGNFRRVLVSSFAPFDPARCLLPGNSDGDPVQTLEAALTGGAIIGVKLYPPMGFRADCNAELADAAFPRMFQPRTPHPGPALDSVLHRLYDVCIRLDCPLMAHCGNSNHPKGDSGERAHPEYWLRLISRPKYRQLRVNLAHFGGVWGFGDIGDPDSGTATLGREARNWAKTIAKSIHGDPERYPNLYVDIGYASSFLSHDRRDPARRATIDFLRELLSDYPVMRGRLMYGSDWQMVGIEEFEEEYTDLVTDAFVPIMELEGMDDFLHGNAARFLGISRGECTYRRLAKFLGNDAASILDDFAPSYGPSGVVK